MPPVSMSWMGETGILLSSPVSLKSQPASRAEDEKPVSCFHVRLSPHLHFLCSAEKPGSHAGHRN